MASFSFFGQQPAYRSLFSGYQQPAAPPAAAPRLSLADLYEAPREYGNDYPQAPTYARDFGDLDEGERRRLRKLTMLKALKAASEGWHQGRAGSALLAAAVEMQQDRADAVENENRRRDEQYAFARERALQEMVLRKQSREQDQERLGAQNRLAMYEQIAAIDPELATQAEGAARSGSDARLAELLGEARKRKAIREGGYGDPDDPFIDEKMQAKLRAEEDERRRKAVLATLPEELRLRNQIEDEQLAGRIDRGLVRDPNRPDDDRGPDEPRWEPDTVTMTDPETGEDAIYMVDKSRLGPDGKPLMTKLGSARERAEKGLQRFMVKDELGYDRPYVFDPATGQSYPDPNFQPNTKKERQGGFLGIGGQEVDIPTGGYKYVPPAPPPAGQGSQARPAPRPSRLIDSPEGAPARGRGEGPRAAGRKPSPQEQAGVGRNPEETSASFARVVQQTGPLPLAARQALKRRLAAGADEQAELRKILEAMGGQP